MYQEMLNINYIFKVDRYTGKKNCQGAFIYSNAFTERDKKSLPYSQS